MNSTKLCSVKRESSDNPRNGLMTSLDDNHKIQNQLKSSAGGNDHNNCNFGDAYDISDNDDDHIEITGNGGPLWLGFLDKPKERSCFLGHSFPNKAGGTPVWLDPIHLPSGKSVVCGFCEEPLQFVLQIYAPITGSVFAYHRAIFVFMCPSMSCLRRDQNEQQRHAQGEVPRSLKVFRCQLPLVNPYLESEDQTSNKSGVHSEPKDALCSWCGTWKGDQICSGCKRVRYCSKKHQVSHWRSSHKVDCKQSVRTCSHKTAPAETQRVASSSLWPEYDITFEDRHESNSPLSNSNGGRSALASNFSDYGDTHSSLVSAEETDEIESMEDYFECDDEKKNFASFSKHTSEDPDQVLRCWVDNGKPLWPELRGRPSEADIPKCHYCSGPMRFEFQILPQILFYFKVENDIDSLDWATIAVYTCEASCDSSVPYKEEFPWVQLYT